MACNPPISPSYRPFLHDNRNADSELVRFKQNIDLVDYAQAVGGFRVDRRRSSAGSKRLVNDASEEVMIVSYIEGQGWMYFLTGSGDGGTIIDFEQRRAGGNLGEVRRRLRQVLPERSQGTAPGVLRHEQPPKGWVPFETVAITASDYLTKERGIPPGVLQDSRFSGAIRQEAERWRNIAFPHCDGGGVCGYELRNRGFKGFSRGGRRGLWLSRRRRSDRRLVITESAIDALSVAALRPEREATYVSLAGTPSPGQLALLGRLVRWFDGLPDVIVATDADQAGERAAIALKEYLRAYLEISPRIERLRPPDEPGDWNDALMGGR
jgi:hypothetical protein